MKKNKFIKHIWVLVVISILSACSEVDPYGKKLAAGYYLEIDNTSLVLNGRESQTVQVSAPDDLNWSIADSTGWISVSNRSARGSASLSIKAREDNPQTTTRTGSIRLLSDRYNLSATVNVSQEGTFINTDRSSVEFVPNGGEEKLTIKTNAEWVIAGCPSWLSCSASQGDAGTINITLTASKNQEISAKESTIKISTRNGAATASVNVKQIPEPVLRVDASEFNLGYSGTSKTVHVTANLEWKASSSDPSWCTVTPSSGTASSDVTVKVTENNTDAAREAVVTIAGGGMTHAIKVKQDYKPRLAINPDKVSFDYQAQETTFTVSSNISWTAKSSSSWCTVSPEKGTNDGTVTVKVLKNDGSSARNSTITIEGGGLKQTFAVSQERPPYLTVSTTEISCQTTSGKYTFDIDSNVSWKASRNATWFTLTPYNGEGTKTVTVDVKENTTGSERSGTITITGTGVTEKSIKVVQKYNSNDIDIDDFGNDKKL